MNPLRQPYWQPNRPLRARNWPLGAINNAKTAGVSDQCNNSPNFTAFTPVVMNPET
jgi:hypothetical protein